jgi:hypothetical protein
MSCSCVFSIFNSPGSTGLDFGRMKFVFDHEHGCFYRLFKKKSDHQPLSFTIYQKLTLIVSTLESMLIFR